MQAGEEVAGRYRLEEELAAGGMAEVWRATDARLERPVAVKFLAPALTGDPEFLVRFFAEAQSAARLVHPNVVPVLDFGQHSERPFIAMQYIPSSLSDLMGEPLDREIAVTYVAQAARGAGGAHEIAIVHRDIKPANILLADDGTAKLGDFGIAWPGGGSGLTATGAVIGSPYYISPEQIAGEPATARSDVYSLGVVLYEALTGRRPFEDKSITAVAAAHVSREPDPPSLHHEMDPVLEDIVLLCLEKDPQVRFADGNELADELDSLGLAKPTSGFPVLPLD
jgi:serine/threonine protein kinase